MIMCCQNTGERELKHGCWKWIAGCDSLQSERRDQKRGREVEMSVAAPFFTADKNICWDINLELQSSLPLLPHHPSSFHTNTWALHPPSSPPPRSHPHTCALKQPYSVVHLRRLQTRMHRQTPEAVQRRSQAGHNSVTLVLCVGRKMQSRTKAHYLKWSGLSSCHSGRLP